jgi:MscS family membrane protein
MSTTIRRRSGASLIFAVFLFRGAAWAQAAVPIAPSASAPAEPPKDVFGRGTPRGTVLGFLNVARKGDDETAALYLNTRLRGHAAATLAHQLSIVLDRRLPARLNQLSDRPEGSPGDSPNPNLELVGTINAAAGDVDITVERVNLGNAGLVWLFSSKTLDSIGDLYDEVTAIPVESLIPAFLAETRIGKALFEYLALLVGIPLLYFLTVLVNRLLRSVVSLLRRCLGKDSDLPDRAVLPPAVRLLIVAAIVRWTLSEVSLPLLVRQFWSNTASVIVIAACVWLAILLNGWAANYLRKHLSRQGRAGTAILLLARRTADGIAIVAGLLIGLHHWGVNPTATLAGLGVGGIAVALAAQKTLENVIGGVSVVFDHVVHVGESLKLGDTQGTVQSIGLRSTRIRTLDRTVVSVPNGQFATASLENLSLRDKFWFHHILGLRYETTAAQMRSVLEGIHMLLEQHPRVERDSVCVRLLRFGASSLDAEVVAYFFTPDWSRFLEIQGELLLKIMEIVQAAGTRMALPSQTLYVAPSSSGGGSGVQGFLSTPTPDQKSMKQNEVEHDTRTDALTGSPR